MAGLESVPSEHDPKSLPEPFAESGESWPEVYDPKILHPHENEAAEHKTHNLCEVYGSQTAAELGPNKYEDDKSNVASKETDKICGLGRRIFYISLVVIILLVAAVVGGAVGGTVGKRETPDLSSASSVNQLTGTATIASTSKTVSIAATPSPVRAITVVEDEVTIFTFWQLPNSDLRMHSYFHELQSWTDPMTLNTSIQSIQNTPIAAATWKVDDYYEIRVHYTPLSEGSSAEHSFKCPTKGPPCEESNTTLITSSPLIPAGAGSSLVSPAAYTLRHYFVGSNGSVFEQAYIPEPHENAGWQEPKAIPETKAHNRTPVAAVMKTDSIWVFWFDEQKQLQRTSSTWSHTTWTNVETIPGTVPKELPRALSAVVSNDPDAVQVFYFDGNDIQQVQYSDNEWQAGNVDKSFLSPSMDNGPMSAVGWNETSVRIYYLIDGEIKELVSERDSRLWTVGTMNPDPYN